MDIRQEILLKHSRKQAERIANYVGTDKNRLAELLKHFFSNEYRLAQRAAYPINILADRNPEIFKPHLTRILKNLEKKGIHDAIKRNTFRLFQFIEIPEKDQALAIELGFRFFLDKKEPIAIRVFAMTVLGNLCLKYPDLSNELIPAIEEEMALEPKPAFMSRGRRILTLLKKHKLATG